MATIYKKRKIKSVKNTSLPRIKLKRKLDESRKVLPSNEIIYRKFFENSVDALLLTDPNGNILSANPAACIMYGYPEEELIKLSRPDVTDITDPRLSALLSERALNGKADGELTLIRKDGTRFPAEVSSAIFKDDKGLEYTSMIIRKITGRKLAEEALKESREKYRNIVDGSPDAIAIYTEGKVVYANNACISLFRASSIDQLIGMPVIKFVHPDFTAIVSMRMNEIGEFQNILPLVKEKLLLLDGTAIDAEVKAIPITFNQRPSVQIIIHDITERKQAEKEIKESKKQLEKLYKHLNNSRENERAEIAREIHDELGQSLTALKMDLYWVLENAPDNLLINKKLKGMIDIVSTTIKKVQVISSGLRPGMLDDLGLIAALEWYTQEFQERTHIKCSLELEEIPQINSKINLILFRIFQEGMTNIIRHANAKNVAVKLYSSFSNIFMKISDDGTGIKKEKINSKDSLGFIGMKERLKQFDGTLEIISSAGSGTSLLISIPMVK